MSVSNCEMRGDEASPEVENAGYSIPATTNTKWSSDHDGAAAAAAAATSLEQCAVVQAAKDNGLSDAGVAAVQQALLDVLATKDAEWSAKYDKLGAIMVARERDTNMAVRQLQADKDALMAIVHNEFVTREFETRQRVLAPAPSPVAAALSAEKVAEMARLKRENAALVDENSKLHDQHASSFGVYRMQKDLIGKLNATNADLEERVRRLTDTLGKLKTQANAKLDEASAENAQLRRDAVKLEKAHDQDTIVIRSKLRRAESEIEELRDSLEQKKRQNAELKDICTQLIEAGMDTSDAE
ncbi:hypothetical protein PFISCL1PPCAC_22650 [Pristionchus fissidentatus]|uniref:Transforming acidic coiled-coil-containing protein C-terminal domain-containing protein n=1 Tax=Pristionchus fissidentatus TaxID=1538716 RepID=A0AAV5WIV1_9BILA|nr:hypothetical protein PFISCL1PPCAC_22650 [Pristionchus fissidentatus]